MVIGEASTASHALLECRDVRYGFPKRPDFLGPISLSVGSGQCWAIVGPNGAGKSTLIRLMAGLTHPHDGDVLIFPSPLGRGVRGEGQAPLLPNEGKGGGPLGATGSLLPVEERRGATGSSLPVEEGRRSAASTGGQAARGTLQSLRHVAARRRAQAIAYVPQRLPGDMDLSVREVVLMGRFPHRSMGLFESAADLRIADQAMTITGTLPFADRPLTTLSGGETQRVHVAAALAQEPRVLLLDEPTASLDLQHQLAIFGILQERAAHDGLGVVVVTHDINLAARFCSHVLLLHEGKAIAVGRPEEVLTPAILEPVYEVRLAALGLPDVPLQPWLIPIG